MGVLEFLVLDREEFGAETFDLLLGCGPHVGRGDDGAKPARGRDRLQAGDADAITNTFAAGIVPAAVIIIGKARPNASAASITAR